MAGISYAGNPSQTSGIFVANRLRQGKGGFLGGRTRCALPPYGVGVRGVRWWPSGVKFSGASQAWKRARMGGHSADVMENQAVSRFSPFTTMWLRKVPS